MGWDIVSIGNQTLDTSNIETLAIQLSDAFNVNIDYGYYNILKYNELINQVEYPNEYQFVKLGRVIKEKKCELYHLTDNYYSEKIIYEKFGGRINNVKYSKLDNVDEKEFLEYEMEKAFEKLYQNKIKFSLEKPWENKKLEMYSIFYVEIINDIISISISEPFRWFGFVNQLKKNNKYFDYFVKYRNRMVELYKSVGADQVVYFSDQGVTEFIIDKFWDANWNELLDYIKSQTYHYDYINTKSVDNKFRELDLEKFNNRHKQLQISISDFFLQGTPFLEQDEDIEILFDDFKDLFFAQ